ncbi:PIG-L family deacetylase [bacterium]|nr:PIG-L family deacetylase [bacterium]
MKSIKNKNVTLQGETLSYDLPQRGENISHLAIGAHPDDVEIFAYNAIEACYQSKEKNFAAIICTNGSGAPKYGEYKNKSKDEIIQIRKMEQQKAAQLGQYSGLIHFNHESEVVKNKSDILLNDLKLLLDYFKPNYIFTHNPFDAHATHRYTLLACLKALKAIDHQAWLKGFFACEVWGSLDWLPSQFKYVLGENNSEELQKQLLNCFYSQNVGSQKRYDLGTVGRKQGNATFFESDQGNRYTHQSYAIDLLPVLNDSQHSLVEYCQQIVLAFQASVDKNLIDLQ